MPDIAMCPGDGCPRKLDCYRHRAVPTPRRQTYFVKPPARADGSCDYFFAIMRGDLIATVPEVKDTKEDS